MRRQAAEAVTEPDGYATASAGWRTLNEALRSADMAGCRALLIAERMRKPPRASYVKRVLARIRRLEEAARRERDRRRT